MSPGTDLMMNAVAEPTCGKTKGSTCLLIGDATQSHDDAWKPRSIRHEFRQFLRQVARAVGSLG